MFQSIRKPSSRLLLCRKYCNIQSKPRFYNQPLECRHLHTSPILSNEEKRANPSPKKKPARLNVKGKRKKHRKRLERTAFQHEIIQYEREVSALRKRYAEEHALREKEKKERAIENQVTQNKLAEQAKMEREERKKRKAAFNEHLSNIGVNFGGDPKVKELKAKRRIAHLKRQEYEVAEFLEALKEGSKYWVTKENIDQFINEERFGKVPEAPRNLEEVPDMDESYLGYRPFTPVFVEHQTNADTEEKVVEIANILGIDENMADDEGKEIEASDVSWDAMMEHGTAEVNPLSSSAQSEEETKDE